MRKHNNAISERDMVLWVNIVLMGVSSLLLFYYVMMANSIASKNYRINNLRTEAQNLAEANGILTAEKLSLEHILQLQAFAQSRGLVEAKNISYIFENRNVAQR